MPNEEKEEVGQNNPKNDARNAIARESEKARADEMEGIEDEDPEEAVETVEAHEEQPEQKTEDTPEPKKYKLKVNGKEIELTEEQLIERAQKVEAADDYLQSAYQIHKDAKGRIAPKEQPVDEVDPDLELARAIQMGSEEEARAAIKKLRADPQVQVREIDDRIRQYVTFTSDATRFQEDYKDLMENEHLKGLVAELDAVEHAKGVPPGYDRFKAVGDRVREIAKSINPTMETKLAKKASVHQIPSATARASVPTEEEQEESPSQIVAQMAKARGQAI